MRTNAYVSVHGVGVHDSGDLARETFDAVGRGADVVGGSVEVLGVPDDAPVELVHRAQVNIPDHEPFIAEFYDGWWDARARRPSFWVVLLWLLDVVPFALLSAVGGWFSDRWREACRRSSGHVVALLTTGVLLALTPLVAGLLLVGLPLAGLVPAWRSRLHPVMVEILGDVWLYRSDELDEEVIPHLCRIVHLAQGRADRVTLVGHSQGAELSRRVALLTAPRRCVWVGSGEHQLNTVRMLATTRWLPLVVWPLVLAWPVFVHQVIHWAAGGLDADSGPLNAAWVTVRMLFVVASMAFYGLVAAQVVRWLQRVPDDVGRVPPSRIWHVKSLLDPVSYGTIFPSQIADEPPLPESPEPEVPQQEVPERGRVWVRYVPAHAEEPWWREHVSYFSRPSTGAVLLEAGLDDPTPLWPKNPPRVPLWWVMLAPATTLALILCAYLVGRWQLGLFP